MKKQTDKELMHYWENYRSSLMSDQWVEQKSHAEILKHKILLEQDPLQWIKFFFPQFAYAEFAPFHKKAIKRLIKNEEWYEVLSWSRELSKSTVTMFVVLYLALTGKKRNIILTSSSYDNAERLLEPYRANLDSNQRIMAYYGKQEHVGSWEMGEFTTTKDVSFRAVGAKQSPRGTKNKEVRPDVIIADDFDTDQDCLNPDMIDKNWNWFQEALYPTRSISMPLLVIWCGNVIATDCCITRAGKLADNWDIINIRDKNGVSSWPEKNSEAHINRVLSKMSTKASQQEYFNNPLSEGKVFKEIRWGQVPPLNKFKFIISYSDPAPSNKGGKKTSYKSNFLIGCLEGVYYIITGYLDHVTNDEFVNWYYYIHETVNARTQIYFYQENNTLQDPFYQQVFIPLFFDKGKEHGYYLSISSDERKKPDKFSRIEGTLEPLNKQGRMVLNIREKDNPHMLRLEEQFKLIDEKLAAPADGPDCIEGGVYILNQKMRTSAFTPKTGRRKKDSHTY